MKDKGPYPPRGPNDSPPDLANVLSTTELIDLAQAGDQDSLETLCARYLPRLRRWSRGRLPRHARGLLDTEDLVQDTLLRAMKNLKGITSPNEGAFQVYLRTTILNRIRDAARRPDLISPLQTGSDNPITPAPSPLEDLIGKDTLATYDRALASLKENDQAAIIGRIEMGISYAELALILDKKSPDAARMAVGRALTRLAKEMGHDQP